MEEELTLEQKRAVAVASARLRVQQQQRADAMPDRTPAQTAGQYAGVVGSAIAPYALASAGGAVAGGPAGALLGPLALGLTDIGAMGVNLGAQIAGSERRVPLASQTIRGGLQQVAPSVFRTPETPGQEIAASGAEAAVSALTQANALRQLASQYGPGFVRNLLAETGRAPVVQAGAAVPAAATTTAMSELSNEGSILQDPYARSVAGVLAGMIGGAGTARVTRTGRVEAPGLDELRVRKNQLYKSIDESGVQFAPQAYDDWLQGLRSRLKKFDPDQHTQVELEIKQLEKSMGQARSFRDLDGARSEIKKSLGKSNDPNVRRLGRELADDLDDFILNTPQGGIIAGNQPQAAAQLREARKLYTSISKSEEMAELLHRAQLSGRPLDDAVRTEFRNLARNPRRLRLYTPEERQFIENVVQQGKVAQNLTALSEALRARTVLGGGLYAGTGVGVFVPQVDPLLAFGAAGTVYGTRAAAGGIANRLARARAEEAGFRMRGGTPTTIPRVPQYLGTAIGTETGLNSLSPPEIDFMREQARINQLMR